MTTGEGIFWATVLVLIVLGIRYISRARKWKITALIVGCLLVLSVLVGVGLYFYDRYENRVVPQDSLFGIILGASPVDVKLALGEPEGEVEGSKANGDQTLLYFYKTYSYGEIDRTVRFESVGNNWKVYQICDLDPSGGIYSLATYTAENEVIAKLGNFTSQSISEDGLRKFLTFDPLNIAVEIEKKRVTSICVTSNQTTRYIKEYSFSANTDSMLKVQEGLRFVD